MNSGGKGLIVLLLGILSWVLGFSILLSIPGWIIANNALKANDWRDASDKQMLEIGRWICIANVALSVLGCVCVLPVYMLMGGAMLGGALGG